MGALPAAWTAAGHRLAGCSRRWCDDQIMEIRFNAKKKSGYEGVFSTLPTKNEVVVTVTLIRIFGHMSGTHTYYMYLGAAQLVT